MEIAVVAVVAAGLCALLSGVIAQQKGLPAAGYVIAGLLLGLIGVIIAAVARPEPRVMPGWYPDPWGQAPLRWHDGRQWTPMTHAATAQR